jgi:outer membrane immunogenic protein
MKKLIVVSLGLSLLAAVRPALAADLPVKAPVYKAPQQVSDPFVDPWTGFYAGVNAGYSWGPWNSNNPASVGNTNFINGATFVDSAKPHVDGATGGVQIGHNWLVAEKFVLGLEGDFQLSGEKASQTGEAQRFNILAFDNRLIGSTALANNWKLPWFSTFRARAGFVGADNWLIYSTAGLALINAKYASAATNTLQRTTSGGTLISSTTTTATNSETTTRIGFALGGGVEKKLSSHWNARLEYLYIDAGTHNFVGGSGADTSVRIRDHVVRVGLNYMFGQ